MNIDNVRVKSEGVFSPTVKYIEDKYRLFNSKYFDNKLPDPFEFRTRIVETNWYAGMTLAKRYEDSAEFFELRISRYTQMTEKVYCEIILHEMIHVYQICILKMLTMPHDESFTNKMDEINNYGWNVLVTLNNKDEEVYPSIKKSVSKRVLVVIYGRTSSQKGAFVTYRQETEINNLGDFFYKYDVFNIKNPEILKKYYFISDICDVRKPDFDVQIIKDEDISNMIKNKDIELIPLREFLIRESDDNVEKKGYDNTNNYHYQSKVLIDDNGEKYQIIGVE